MESLELGDSITNGAAIYFDFNYPIITNTYSTTVQQIIDEDNDGFNEEDDCDDLDPNINPLATEIVNNGIDEDCNGEDLLSSIDDIENNNIKIFPNPSTGLFNISTEQALTIVVSDLNGKVMIEKQIDRGNTNLHLDAITQGLYIVQFYKESELIDCQKLVIHK